MDMLHTAPIVADILAFALAIWLMYKTRDWRLSFLAALAVLVAVNQWIGIDLAGNLGVAGHTAFHFAELSDLAVSVAVLLSVFFVGRLIESERERTDALRVSEARYRSLFDNTPVMLHSEGPDARLVDVNRHWLKVMGYNREEVLGIDTKDFLTDESRRQVENVTLPTFLRSGSISEIPLSLKTKEGGSVDVLLSSVAQKDAHGAFVSSRTVMVDVTKQREAERAQQESERTAAEAQTLLLQAMESSPDGIAIYDSDDRLKLYNEAFSTGVLSGVADLIEPGVRYEQLLRAAVERNLVAIPDGDVESYVHKRLEQHRRGERSIEIELANGRWMLSADRRLPGGGIVGTRSDITDLKRAELALKASRRQAADALAMLTEAMESNPDAVAIFDADERLTHFNEAYRAGFSPQLSEAIKPGARFEDILRAAIERKIIAVPDGDDEAYLNKRVEHHRRGDRSVELEMADGRWFLFSERRMPGGGTVSTRSDVTERKLSELALQESEQRLRTMIENVPGVVFRRILHADGSVTFPFLSSNYSKILGIESDAAMNDPHVILGRLHPDDREEWMAAWRKSAKSLAPFDREVRIFRSANDLRWFRVRALPQRFPDGETLWDAIGIDVTEEKRAAEIRDRMFAALENLTEGVALFGPDDRLVYTNPRYIEFNQKAGSVIKPGKTFEQIVRRNVQLGGVPDAIGHEEDWIAERMQAHRAHFYVEERKMGGRWLDIRETILPDGSTVLLNIDIDERRRAHAALAESEARMRLLADSLPVGINYLDTDLRYRFANKTYCAWHGIDPDEIIGKTTREVLGAEAIKVTTPSVKAALAGEYVNLEAKVPYKISGLRYVQIIAVPHADESGKIVGTYGVVIDITEQKRASEIRDQMFVAMENLSEGVALFGPDDLLVFANRRFIELNEEAGPEITPGQSFEEIMYAGLVLGRYPEAKGREEEWIAERLEAHRNPPFAAERKVGNIWQNIREEATPDGSVIYLISDITQRKMAEEEIRKNEEQLSLVTENIPAFISYIGRDERFRFANSAYGRSFGDSLRNIEGMSLREYWGEESYATFSSRVKRVLAGETVNFENTLPAKGGGSRHVAVTYVPHFIDGKVEAFFSLATDITQQVATRQALRERGHRIRNILENISDGVITIDDKGKIQSFNQAAERMFGYAASEILGRAVSKLMTTSDRKRHPRYILNYLKTGKGKIIGVGRREVTGLRKNGTTFPASLGISEMWIGEKRNFIGSLLDMTQQEAAKEALRARDERLHQLQSELLRINRTAIIGQLSSSLTHELKQPLAAATFYMQAIGQLLTKDGVKPDDKIAEIIGKVGDQVGRAAAVVGRLGPLFERGEVKRREAEINDVVEEAVAVAALELDRKNIALKTILGRKLPRLPVDKIQVQQVLLNLVRNAVEATRDSKRRELTVRTRATKDSKVEVSVSDSGCGIPAKLRSSIFDPFVTSRTGGTGMGLSVSRAIVEAHGGRIWASPRRGGGTIMHFTLGLATREFERSAPNVRK